MMNDLPNGFTGFAGVNREEFESAADASRRQRGEDPAAEPAARGSFQYARDLDSGRRVETELPFAKQDIDEINPLDLRWAWVEVDLSAIRHNVAETRKFLQSRSRLLAVVKADAYGHGSVQVAKAALGAGADRLAVATVPEGIKLRKAGITAPIMLLAQPPATSIPALLGYNIVPTVYEPDFAVAYGEAADLRGMKAPYHLAVNTGMNRIGVRFDEAVEFLHQVSFHRALELDGVFTHYATADCPETLDFSIQSNRFADAIESIRAAGFDPGVVHSANSASIYRYPNVHYDMVRLGVSLYGLHPCPETRDLVDLRPAMSVHARITDTRFVPMSEGVSYGLHYRSPGSVKICTVPIGYADGLRRGLSGNTDFILGGRYYRQVGNICMDQCMFEVDMRSYGTRERIDPQVGDEVIIVGTQGIAEVTLDEMAEKLGTIHYELACGFGQRMDRIYV
ncbi:MAG: alanine racemase [Eggerthellaceae bacterium]|nr:alanine racemase [Eggerthellaceae bacterium]